MSPMRRRPTWRRLLRKSFRVGVIVAVCLPVFVVSAGAVGITALVYGDLEGTVPTPRPAFKAEPTEIFLANFDGSRGEKIAEFRKFELTLPMKREDVPAVLKNAVVASEDHQFWTHKGVDPLGMLRAARVNYEEGTASQGGSTITQQVVRERYLSRERTTERKFNEVLLATRFERDLASQIERETGMGVDDAEHEAKERILFEYLDTTYFGAGAYGAQAASQTYFHKDVKDITASEAALLVAIIPSPSKYTPRENLAVAEQRRKNVLKEMHELDITDPAQVKPGDPSKPMLTQPEFDAAVDQSLFYAAFGEPPKPMTVIYPPPPVTYGKYPYYVDYVRQYLLDKYGPDQLYLGGLKVIIAIDQRLQGLAEAAVGNTLSGTSAPLEMSMVSVEPSTGQVKALVGGRDWNVSQVNLATGGSLGMQPGSTFKAFTTAKALEEGYSAETQYFAPGILPCGGGCAIRGGTGGIETLRSALANSINTYFYQLALDLGPNAIAEMANRLGVTRIKLDKQYNAGITLGQDEVSPLDMAAAFSVFPNHGIKPGATPVLTVTDSSGKVIEDNSAPHGKRVINAAVADWTTELLTGNVRYGTGTAAQIGRPVGGKTGTAQNFKAAWFVGFTPQLSTSVWMGYSDTPKPLINIKGVGQVFGGTHPARTWAAYMRQAMDGQPKLEFTPPGILPPPSSGIRHIPRDFEVPEMPLDCNGPCVDTPVLTSPTTAPPDEEGTSSEDCEGECKGADDTTTTRPRTGKPTTTVTTYVPPKGAR